MASPSPTPTLAEGLRALGLRRIAEDLADLLARATRSRWSPAVLLEELVRAEAQDRARRSLERRLARARLGRFKPMAEFDWAWPKAIDREAVERVLGLGFLEDGSHVILAGAQGLGKTMLARNVGHQAVLQGHSVRCVTPAELLLDLGGPRRPPAPWSGGSGPTSSPGSSSSTNSGTSPTTTGRPTCSSRWSAAATSGPPSS